MRRYLSVFTAFVFLFSTAHASEVDLIYNLTGPSSQESRAAWHGVNIASQMLKEQGQPLHIVLYNGESNKNVNHAIGAMRAKHKETRIFIGLGKPELLLAAAKPLIAANKVFISASSLPKKALQSMGPFLVTATASTEEKAQRLIKFANKRFNHPSFLVVYDPREIESPTTYQALRNAALGAGSRFVSVPTSGAAKQDSWLKALQSHTGSLANQTIILASKIKQHQWLHQIRHANILTPVVAQTSVSITTQKPMIGPHVALFVSPAFVANDPSTVRQFKQRYTRHYGSEPPAAAYNGYNALTMAAYALSHAKTDNLSEVTDIIRALKANHKKSDNPLLLATSESRVQQYPMLLAHNNKSSIG